MDVGIVDSGSGNLRSLAKAVECAGRQREGGDVRVHIIARAEEMRRMERLLLPGVGAFSYTMNGLRQGGLLAALEEAVLERGRPFLGICVGMQILLEWGLEHGRCRGLAWLPGTVQALSGAGGLRVPHMGWNELHPASDVPKGAAHPLFAHFAGGQSCHVYFSHSYHARLQDARHCLATSEYGGVLTAAVGRDNILGMQFHPEKSQRAGLELLRRFLDWKP